MSLFMTLCPCLSLNPCINNNLGGSGPLAASHINPLWPRSTAKTESVWFFQREENLKVWKTLKAQQRNNAQLNSHIWPWQRIETGSPWWEVSALRTSQPCHKICRFIPVRHYMFVLVFVTLFLSMSPCTLFMTFCSCLSLYLGTVIWD